jgi:hypothetical protein
MALVFVVIGLFLFGMLELFEWKDANRQINKTTLCENCHARLPVLNNGLCVGTCAKCGLRQSWVGSPPLKPAATLNEAA